MPIARIYETVPLLCLNCGGTIQIIAFITEAAPISHIFQQIGEPLEPPPLHPARWPPYWAEDENPAFCLDEDLNQDRYKYEYDKRVSW